MPYFDPAFHSFTVQFDPEFEACSFLVKRFSKQRSSPYVLHVPLKECTPDEFRTLVGEVFFHFLSDSLVRQTYVGMYPFLARLLPADADSGS